MQENAPGLEDLDDRGRRFDAGLVEQIVDEGHGVSAAQGAGPTVSDERQDMIAEMSFVGGGGIGILLPPAPPFNQLSRIVPNAQQVSGIW
ncbi:hypothetical protein [Streptomyces phaeochromogenes]|uniref:hypothetical protein n=1 Tax=Streptomyces phaeochromogenes TaxID=1923 RepID=UPI001FE1EED0|nr:hypothetical protein [Streptomyces phaeochromogenes]